MRLHRFFIKDGVGTRITDGATINQWRKVFRFGSGDKVILFDDSGFEYVATIARFYEDGAEVTLDEKRAGIIPSREIWLCMSIIKKDNFEWVVEKATELGVTHIVPVISGRTEKKALNMERLRSIAKEASEQSGRANIPIVHEAVALADSFAVISNVTEKYVCDTGEVIGKISGSAASIALYIGPEGGWDDADKALFVENKITSISLGALVLRAETAAIAGMVVVSGM